MRWTLAGAAGWAILALAAACTSSGGGTGGSSPPGPLPATTDSTDTSTSSSSTTTAPAPTTSAPLSHFEGDPGVAALREWAAVAAHTVNTGHYTSPQLRKLMTPLVAEEMKQTFGTDVGLHYPGPVPFTPVRVGVTSTTSRQIDVCLVSTGFAHKPQSTKPAKPLKIIPVRSAETQTGGRWLLSTLLSTTAFSCSGVHVPMPRF
jgi:hypothetical protein